MTESFINLWACEPNYLADNIEAFSALFARPLSLSDILSIEGDKASISIRGPLYASKYALIAKAVKEAVRSPAKYIDLRVDSPGGSVSGVGSAYQAIADESRAKTVTAYNMGSMASAAYWIASPANEIVAVNAVVETGSIGTYFATYDFTDSEKKEGIKKVVVLSANAPYKNPSVVSEEGQKEIKRRIDAVERVMLDDIARGRGITTEEVINNYGKGAVFIAKDPKEDEKDALNSGLIDRVLGQETTRSDSPITAQTEEETMDVKSLSELYAAYPSMRAVVEEEMRQARAQGEKSIREQYAELSKIIEGDAYLKNAAMRAMIVEAFSGKREVSAVLGAVSAFDAVMAASQIASAAQATEGQGSSHEKTTTKDLDPKKIAASKADKELEDMMAEDADMLGLDLSEGE